MTVTTRPEQPGADQHFLRDLILQNLAVELRADQWPETVRDRLLELQYQGRRYTAPNSYPEGQSSIVLADGTPVGWLYTADLDEAVYLAEILIRAEFRGRGIGSAVVRGVIGGAGERAVRLNVSSLNLAAIAFYDRLGFRRVQGDEVNQVMEYGPVIP